MEGVDRKKQSLQMGAVLCAIAAVLHLLAMEFWPLVVGGMYAATAVGLYEQSKATSHWGSVTARVVAAFNGLLNLVLIVGAGCSATSNLDEPSHLPPLSRSIFWLFVNALIFVAVLYGAGPEERHRQSKPMGLF